MKLRACRSNPRENTASDSNSAVISGSPCLARKFPRSGAGERETKGIGGRGSVVPARPYARKRSRTRDNGGVRMHFCTYARAFTYRWVHSLSLSLSSCAYLGGCTHAAPLSTVGDTQSADLGIMTRLIPLWFSRGISNACPRPLLDCSRIRQDIARKWEPKFDENSINLWFRPRSNWVETLLLI